MSCCTRVILAKIKGASKEPRYTTRKRFANLRLTCKLWKDIGETPDHKQAHLTFSVDSFTDWLTDDDLLLAVKRVKVESLRFLLTRNELDPSMDPSAADNKAIITAVCKGHTDTVRLLLIDPPVDPSASDSEALRYAVDKGRKEMVQLLLSDPRVDPSIRHNYAIRRTVCRGPSL
ncbi:hypothetical protein PROFUN_00928 [Planoprotostelium fungivorum]|uniref:Uncharacterized protein n=1 Tax=Planoprotostelium fungivorum TaxID=1890364 RepID=A0A2P6N465_9EUKA|nr:hypothetical protein PROFUN_00928 [Planoprotostelium fungivorum]